MFQVDSGAGSPSSAGWEPYIDLDIKTVWFLATFLSKYQCPFSSDKSKSKNCPWIFFLHFAHAYCAYWALSLWQTPWRVCSYFRKAFLTGWYATESGNTKPQGWDVREMIYDTHYSAGFLRFETVMVISLGRETGTCNVLQQLGLMSMNWNVRK